MTENKTLDPFKPVQPHIPGVYSPDEKTKAGPGEINQTSRGMRPPRTTPGHSPGALKLVWVGLILAGAIVTVFLLFGLNHKSATTGVPEPREAGRPASPAPRQEATTTDPVDTKLPVGPGPIATTAQLAKAWSARGFYFRDAMTQKPVAAIVVRLPGGALWGFSLREPYGTCELEYVTDLGKLQRNYDFMANHPMVADPCNKTVFDLMRYGNGPSGLVRGEIAQGAGWRPPIAIEMRSQNDQVIAVRMEP